MKPSTLLQSTYQHYASLSQVVKQEQPDTYQRQESDSVESKDLAQELNESSRLQRIRLLNQSYLAGLNQLNPRPQPPSASAESEQREYETEIVPPKSFQNTALSAQRAKKASLHQSKLMAPLSGPPRIV